MMIIGITPSLAVPRLDHRLWTVKDSQLRPLGQVHVDRGSDLPQRAAVSLSLEGRMVEVTFSSYRMRHGVPTGRTNYRWNPPQPRLPCPRNIESPDSMTEQGGIWPADCTQTPPRNAHPGGPEHFGRIAKAIQPAHHSWVSLFQKHGLRVSTTWAKTTYFPLQSRYNFKAVTCHPDFNTPAELGENSSITCIQ